jgi:hypothetical protein
MARSCSATSSRSADCLRNHTPAHTKGLPTGSPFIEGHLSSRGGTRTPDPVINSHLLYQLSYSGKYNNCNDLPRCAQAPVIPKLSLAIPDCHWAGVESLDAPLLGQGRSDPNRREQTLLPRQPQVARHAGLRDVHGRDEVADGALAVVQDLDEAAARRVGEDGEDIGAFRGWFVGAGAKTDPQDGRPGTQPGNAAACFTQVAICASSRSSSWMSIQRASLPVPPGGTGRSDVPRKKVTLT